jgi:hypothetical protein
MCVPFQKIDFVVVALREDSIVSKRCSKDLSHAPVTRKPGSGGLAKDNLVVDVLRAALVS